MLVQRLSIAKKIFTKEEIRELTRYEFAQLWEFSKQHIEWFVYSIVILLWICVVSITMTLFRMSKNIKPVNAKTVVENTISEAEQAKLKTAFNVCKVIDENKSPKSTISSNSIYEKVLVESTKWKLDPCFILALIEKESNFYESAVGGDYNHVDKNGYKIESLGWSQATKSAWDTFNAKYVWKEYKETWPVEDKKDPDKSLTFICWYLIYIKDTSNYTIENTHDLYAAYNAGQFGNFKKNKDAQKNADKFDEIYNRYFIALN